MTDIGDLGGNSAVAYGINDSGVVVGAAYLANGEIHPFAYRNGHMVDLGTLGSTQPQWWNAAASINKSGVIVGTSYDAEGNFFGFRWANGKMQKMGTLGGLWSQAAAINDHGQITGLAYTKAGLGHGFISNGAKLIDLGTFSGPTSTVWGIALNNAGVVVGQSTFKDTYHAFVYTGGQIKDLNHLIPSGTGWTLISAEGINDTGQIAGQGKLNGQQHAFLLTPQ
jgi:probable HAF family extracellular repeat protein